MKHNEKRNDKHNEKWSKFFIRKWGNYFALGKSWHWSITKDERIRSGVSLAKPDVPDPPIEWLTEEENHMPFFLRNI